MLRLKGERGDEITEASDPDEITAHDAFGEGLESGDWDGDHESAAEARAGGRSLRGPGVAAAAFVPTFLAIFLGLPHLFGSPPLPTPPPPAPVAAPAPARDASRPETTADSGDRAAAPRAEAPAAPDTDAPALSLPPLAPREPEALPKAPARRAAEVRRARVDPQESGGEWSPAAAFADRAAADRLASGIRARGRRVEIRADGAPSEPWVVWVRAEPSSRRR